MPPSLHNDLTTDIELPTYCFSETTTAADPATQGQRPRPHEAGHIALAAVIPPES